MLSQSATPRCGWSAFLHTTLVPTEEGGLEKRYRLYHASFREFLEAAPLVQAEGIDLGVCIVGLATCFLKTSSAASDWSQSEGIVAG